MSEARRSFARGGEEDYEEHVQRAFQRSLEKRRKRRTRVIITTTRTRERRRTIQAALSRIIFSNKNDDFYERVRL
jgi:hypothetical protein